MLPPIRPSPSSMKFLSRDQKTALTALLIVSLAGMSAWNFVPGFRETLTRLFSSDVSQPRSPSPQANMKQYEYTGEGIKVQMEYPLDWNERNIGDPVVTGDLVGFSPAEESSSEPCKAEVMIKVKIFPEEPLSIDEYKNSTISLIKEHTIAADIISQTSDDTLSNFRAYRVVYRGKYGQCDFKRMEIGTVRNNKAYYITYRAKSGKYDQYLPSVKNMIKSFEISE